MTAAPIHYGGHRFDVAGMTELVTKVRASVFRAASAALDVIAAALPEPVVSISLRTWPTDFPDDIAVQLRAPYEARANAIMYRHILADLAHTRDWKVHLYEAKQAETQAAGILADRRRVLLALGQHSGRRGQRTIESRSPRPSSAASWAPAQPEVSAVDYPHPAATGIERSATAAASCAWSRSFWSAYATANAAKAS